MVDTKDLKSFDPEGLCGFESRFPYKSMIFIILFAFLCPVFTAAAQGHLVEVGPGYSSTSVNTAVFRRSSLASNDSLQYIAYYGPDGFLTLGLRRLPEGEWTLHNTGYRARVEDAHNVASIGLDGRGILHVAFDHHGDTLRYARTIMPGSLELGPLETMTGLQGESDVTYPEFHSLPRGDLLFAFRSGVSGAGNLVLNRYHAGEERWERLHDIVIDGEGQRNAYWQIHLDHAGTLHLSWVWRESWLVETNHDLCYARSRDGGLTWEDSSGRPLALPITAGSAEYAWRIPQGSELINQTDMTADPAGRPIIATYWREEGDSVPQYRIVRLGSGGWEASQVSRRHTPFSLSGGGTKMIPISRPRVAADGDETYVIFRDSERGSRVSLARSSDGKNWSVADLSDFSVGAWEPSIDEDLWRRERKLHIFVQPTAQGDGERTVATEPKPVYVLEAD